MSETDVPRISPHRVSAEPAAVREWLDFHRATLLRKCAGLDDEQLKRASCPPSNLTLLGLVRHMTDVERGWFLRGVGGHSEAEVPPLYYSDEEPEGDVEDLDSASTQAVFATYEQTIAEIRAATADADLDATFTQGQLAVLGPVGVPPHDRGVRPPQRPRRPHPGAHRRRDRPVGAPGTASGRRENLVQGLEEEIGVFALEYKGRTDLEHVSGRAGRAEQYSPLAHRLGHVAGVPGRWPARLID
jgi:uncharacterized damage-inducible protein DinB